jgi:hypothetical protein
MTLEPILTGADTPLSDHRKYPGCRLQLLCTGCGWGKAYAPERIIDRLHELRVGGHPTTLQQVAARVGRPCPLCGQRQWNARFAWPEGIDLREIKRLANLYRH